MKPERKEFLSKVMKLAWSYTKNHKMSKSDAMKAAWSAMRIGSALRQNKSLVIYFKKVDGTIRRAVATLNKEMLAEHIPNFQQTEYTPKKAAAGVQRFFDLEKKEWRSFKIANFIGAEI